MSPRTHCLPNGSLGIDELAVSQVCMAANTAYVPSAGLGVGAVRGVVVRLHQFSITYEPIPSFIGPDDNTFLFNDYTHQLMTSLVADGWIVLSVPYPEDYYVAKGNQGIFNDVTADPNNGARYLAMTLHWWQHVCDLIHEVYGNLIPIVPLGFSWGGWHAIQIAANSEETIAGFAAHVPATILQNANPIFTGIDFNSTPTTGLDIGVHALDGVGVPGIVGYGTNDGAVGWQHTASPPGTLPINSNTDAMLTNAGAVTNDVPPSPACWVQRHSTGDTHEFTSADATYFSGTFFANVLDPICPLLF